jgi:hypothetical protein
MEFLSKIPEEAIKYTTLTYQATVQGLSSQTPLIGWKFEWKCDKNLAQLHWKYGINCRVSGNTEHGPIRR